MGVSISKIFNLSISRRLHTCWGGLSKFSSVYVGTFVGLVRLLELALHPCRVVPELVDTEISSYEHLCISPSYDLCTLIFFKLHFVQKFESQSLWTTSFCS